MEEGVLEEHFQALNGITVKQPDWRLGGLCCLHKTVLPLGAAGEELD